MLLFDAGKKLEKAVGKEAVTKEHMDMRLKELELRLLKWQLSIGFAIILVMAKGFGWLGF